jgi:hypothetical protein
VTAPQIDYQAVLNDLEEKRRQLDAAIAYFRGLVSGAAVSEEGAGSSANSAVGGSSNGAKPVSKPGGVTLERDTFFGMSTPSAIKKFLGMTKRPQSPRAIADALHAGGQVQARDAKVAYTNVYSALKRLQDTDFSQIASGEWGLVEWYRKPKAEGE